MLQLGLLELFARLSNQSIDSAYDEAMGLLALIPVSRAILIWIGEDPVTAVVERRAEEQQDEQNRGE